MKKNVLQFVLTVLVLCAIATNTEAQKVIPYDDLDVAVWKYRNNVNGTSGGGARNLIDPDKADTDSGYPLTRTDPDDPSTWVQSANRWTGDFQGPNYALTNHASTALTDDPWFIIDLGSNRDLEKMHIWNVSEGTGWTRGIDTFNLYYATSPTSSVTWWAKSGSLPSSATDYDFQSGGWTQFGTTFTVDRGAGGDGGDSTPSKAMDLEIDFSGGVTNARYIGLEIKTNLGDSNGRAGLNAIVLTEIDTDPPVISSLSPTNTSIDVATHTDLVITFDETIATNSGDMVITNLTDSTGTTISMGDSQLSISGATLTVDQSAFMDLGDTFSVLLDSGAVSDPWGNNFSGISDTNTWRFTTTPQASPTATVSAATDVYAISGTMNAVLSAGGEADAWLAWGTSIPGSPNDTNAWANLLPLGFVSQNAPISTNMTPLSTSTTYYYRMYATNSLGTNWSVTTNFITGSATNTITATAGTANDSWNEPSNWSDGFVPRETQQAVVSAGLDVRVDSAAPEFTGGVVISNNASLMVGYGTDVAEEMNVLSDAVTMYDGSKIIFRRSHATINSSFEIVGNTQIDGTSSSSGHHTTRTFTSGFSGSGAITFWSGNNNTFNLNAAGTISGSVSVTNGNCTLSANIDGALGTANVYAEDAASLVIASSLSDTIDDGAELHLNGVKDSGLAGKLVLNSSETVDKLFIDGIQQNSGTYDNGSGLVDSGSNPLISGGGTLTVVTDPPVVPPELTSIEDDVYGGPIWEDYGSAINFTVTFDLDMDDTTVTSNDFENAGTASVTIGAVTEPFAGVFTLPVTPTSTGTIILQIKAGANLETSVGGVLDTTNALPDNTTITVASGNAPDSTITGTADGPGGSDDNWNNSANWDNGVPYGPQSGVVGSGVSAQVDTQPRAYTGELTLLSGASLTLKTGPAQDVIESRTVTLNSGSTIHTYGNFGQGSLTLDAVVLAGNATINGTQADNSSYTFSGGVSGAGSITLTADSNNRLKFTVPTTFSGGATVGSGGSSIEVSSDDGLGTGNVTINASASLWIKSGISDGIDNHAVLYLNGSGSSNGDYGSTKVRLDSNEIVYRLFVDGMEQAEGTYGSTSSAAANQDDTLFSGTSVLTVYTPPTGSVFRYR